MAETALQSAVMGLESPFRGNWRVYVIEGLLLGFFMISACIFVTLIEHPASPLRQQVKSLLARRALIGVAMGLTAIALIYSPWGRLSGAQMNPATTLSFLRMGRIEVRDAVACIAAQFLGGALGMWLMAFLLRTWVGHPSVNYVLPRPGAFGLAAAWVGEFLIAMLLISVVIRVNRVPGLMRFTGCFAGALLALYITFESPISGAGLNPARVFSSALFADVWTGWWIYSTAPVLGMLSGIELHRSFLSRGTDMCAKWTHSAVSRCFIPCDCMRPCKTSDRQS